MEERLDQLEQRLARAERRARILLHLVLAGIAGTLTMAMARPGQTGTTGTVVKAPFQVVDRTGRPLLKIRNYQEGRQEVTEMILLDPEEKKVVTLRGGPSPNSQGTVAVGAMEKGNYAILVGSPRMAEVALHSKAGDSMARVSAGGDRKDSEPMISLISPKKGVAFLGLDGATSQRNR
jgi:hypothetical protein